MLDTQYGRKPRFVLFFVMQKVESYRPVIERKVALVEKEWKFDEAHEFEIQ